MNEQTFRDLCKEFIDAKRKEEEKTEYAETDDLSVLYRFICLDSWRRLNLLKKGKD